MIVVDTSVVSELMRPVPSQAVRDWVLRQQPADLYTTSVTVAEILHGLERLPSGRRKKALVAAATDVFSAFDDHILAFDQPAAAAYATLVRAREISGRPIDGFDAQIAAICVDRRASLATRNTKDFADTGTTLVDPWSAN